MDFIDRKYTLGEEIFNAVSHGTGGLLAIAGMIVLTVCAAINADAREVACSLVYGLTLIVFYTMSTLHHSITHEKAKNIFGALDNASSFLLIAGTYTPYTLCCLRDTLGWTLFGIVWGTAVVAIIFTTIFKKARKLTITITFALGWAMLVAVEALRNSMPLISLVFLILGCTFYAGGLVFYQFKNLHYMHSMWHMFVFAGSIFQYFSILLAIGGLAA